MPQEPDRLNERNVALREPARERPPQIIRRHRRDPGALARAAQIAPHVRRASIASSPSSSFAPNVDELRVVAVEDASAIEPAVAAELRRLLSDGVAPSEVAILSIAGQTKTLLCRGAKIGDYDVVRADDNRAQERTVADTFLRFKGLERPWIIVTELGLGPAKYDVRMHVALTRATTGCVVVAARDEVGSDARLAAVVPR